MLRGSYLLRLAARQPRALTALRVMSTASLAPKEALTSRGKDLTLKIKKLDKKIQALEAKRGELQRMLDEDDFPKWVRAHIDEVNRQLARKGEEPLGEKVLEGLLKGMRSAPEHTQEEYTAKCYDPAWICYTMKYTWDDKVVQWDLNTNLCHADEDTLTIDGETTEEFEFEEHYKPFTPFEEKDEFVITAETFESTPPMFWPILLRKILT